MDDLSALLELQEIDEDIKELEGICRPVRIGGAGLQATQTRAGKAWEEKQWELKELRVKEGKIELDLKDLRSRLVRYERQQVECKTNVVYSALNNKIKQAEQQISDKEDEGLQLIEEIDALEKEIDMQRKEYEENAREFKARESELLGQKRETEGILRQLRQKKERAAKRVPDDLRKRYKRIRDNKEGLAVVPLRDNVCSGCFGVVPIQKVNEIKHDDELKSCDSCGRIIYYNEEGYED